MNIVEDFAYLYGAALLCGCEKMATAITFTAPEVFGSQSVSLKQEGEEWTLGTLVFAERPTDPDDPEYLPRKISQVKVVFKDEWKGDYTQLYTYSYDAEGRLSAMTVVDSFDGEEETLTVEYTYFLQKSHPKARATGLSNLSKRAMN